VQCYRKKNCHCCRTTRRTFFTFSWRSTRASMRRSREQSRRCRSPVTSARQRRWTSTTYCRSWTDFTRLLKVANCVVL